MRVIRRWLGKISGAIRVGASRRIPLSLILFAAYPVLALLAHNVGQIRSIIAMRALLISVLSSTILLIILRLILKDWKKAALIYSLFVILFFTYGHIYEYLQQVSVFVGRHRYIVPFWAFILELGSWLVIKRLHDPTILTSALNITAILILVYPILRIASFEIRFRDAQLRMEELRTKNCEISFPDNEQLPDIYYIILDAYTRQDVLKEVYQYDNSPFLNNLTEMGFYIAQWSQSNYCTTVLSLGSSLNLDYLDLPC